MLGVHRHPLYLWPSISDMCRDAFERESNQKSCDNAANDAEEGGR
jgi:hypothetical protein